MLGAVGAGSLDPPEETRAVAWAMQDHWLRVPRLVPPVYGAHSCRKDFCYYTMHEVREIHPFCFTSAMAALGMASLASDACACTYSSRTVRKPS